MTWCPLAKAETVRGTTIKKEPAVVVIVVNLVFNVGFTEVVPTVGEERVEGRGERELIYKRYTVTTRMISAFRWAGLRAVLINVSLNAQSEVARQCP